MNASGQDLSLLGGPLHRLGCRLGLVRAGSNTVALGLAIGSGLWLVLIALTWAEGLSSRVLSMSAIGVHVRLLVVIPLLFLCETIFNPRVRVFAATIVRAHVVPAEGVPALDARIAAVRRRIDAWLPELLCGLLALLWSGLAPDLALGASVAAESARPVADMPLTGVWYWFVCLTVFRFLMLRWLWRLALWCHFLWSVSRLHLNLVPTHPDGAAGLGYLEAVHLQLFPLVLAISATQAASVAEELTVGSIRLENAFPALALLIAVQAVLVLGPLLIFSSKLWRARLDGLERYNQLASHYVNAFDRKWLGGEPTPAEPLLGTADLQSLADLGSSVNRIQEMRWLPCSSRLLFSTVIATLLPVLPLILFKYPLDELGQKLFNNLMGM
jgi:hypothetical protein